METNETELVAKLAFEQPGASVRSPNETAHDDDRPKTEGDELAFRELFDSIRPIALHHAKRYTSLDMDDCLQEMRLRPFDTLRYSGHRSGRSSHATTRERETSILGRTRSFATSHPTLRRSPMPLLCSMTNWRRFRSSSPKSRTGITRTHSYCVICADSPCLKSLPS